MVTKSEMQTELREFLIGFTRCLGRVYGSARVGGLLGHVNKGAHDVEDNEADLESTDLWRTVDEMYDYGIRGMLREGSDLGKKGAADGEYYDAELFLMGLDSLRLFLEEDNVSPPTLARQAVRTAMARHVLEGGERYTFFDDLPPEGLSIQEVALLADMDERSVRNAASGKTPSLRTEVFGTRAFVDVDEARRWLAGRKGFIPTTPVSPQQEEPKTTVVVARSTADALQRLAFEAGENIDSVLQRLVGGAK